MELETIISSKMNVNRSYDKIWIGNDESYVLLDSGASVSVLGENCFEGIDNFSTKELNCSIKTADGKLQEILGMVAIWVSYNGLKKNISIKHIIIYIMKYIIVNKSLQTEVYLSNL